MPRFGAGVLYTIIPTDRADHDGSLTVTWDTIRAANRAHSDLLARVRRLPRGGVLYDGGGASVAYRIERVM